MPDPDSAGLWLVAAMFLSGISIGFLAAALTLIGVAVFPIRKAGLWTAAGVCFVAACVAGLLILIPVVVLWRELDEWDLLFDILRELQRDWQTLTLS